MNDVDGLVRLGRCGQWQLVVDALSHAPELATARDSIGRHVIVDFAWLGNVQALDLLLKGGADPNARDNDGATPLVACVWGFREGYSTVDATRLLLEHGADPNRVVIVGQSALHVAIAGLAFDHVDLMLRHGANPSLEAHDLEPESGFKIALRTQSQRMIDLLESWRSETDNLRS